MDRTRVRRLAATIAADLRAAGIAGIRSYPELAAIDALPPWLFDEAVQLSQRSSLLRKDPEHYGPLFSPDTPRDLDYVWPVRSPAVIERELRKEENARRRAPSGLPTSWCRRGSEPERSAVRRSSAAGRHASRRRSGRPSGCERRPASSAVLRDRPAGEGRSARYGITPSILLGQRKARPRRLQALNAARSRELTCRSIASRARPRGPGSGCPDWGQRARGATSVN